MPCTPRTGPHQFPLPFYLAFPVFLRLKVIRVRRLSFVPFCLRFILWLVLLTLFQSLLNHLILAVISPGVMWLLLLMAS